MNNAIYLGVKHSVIAFDRQTGAKLWETDLNRRWLTSSCFLNLVHEKDALYAYYDNTLFCLSPQDGSIRWENKLSGLGWGVMTAIFASAINSQQQAVIHEVESRRHVAAGAAAAGAA